MTATGVFKTFTRKDLDPEGSALSDNSGPLFILHHGAGQSAKSFSLLAKSLGSLLPNCQVLAFDSRYLYPLNQM